MKPVPFAVIILAFGFSSAVEAQTSRTYRPLGSWTDPAAESLARWEDDLKTRVARAAPVRADTRPQLAGLRPRSVELLEDGLLRKHPKLLKNNPTMARQMLLRRIRRGGTAQVRGYLAEAIFLERHPEWGYVGKPNATQHDVYRLIWRNGKAIPETGQIKYHDSGKPSRYARDMLKDHRAPRFLIPDDHVEPTKAYLRAAGRWRDASRVQPIGSTSDQIRSDMTKTARYLARERYAKYTSLGATLVLAIGTPVYDWARGDLPANMAAYRTVRSLSLIGVNVGGDLALRQIGRGALRGTVRGNAIIGTAIAITETAWLLHEHGWGRAFYHPEFYEQVGGSVSALALGLAGGTYATGLAVETGPWAPVIGTGVGILTGTIGYMGGRTVARALIEIISPEMLRSEERQRLESVKLALDRQIANLQTLKDQ